MIDESFNQVICRPQHVGVCLDPQTTICCEVRDQREALKPIKRLTATVTIQFGNILGNISLFSPPGTVKGNRSWLRHG
jgi:hypothetical protein